MAAKDKMVDHPEYNPDERVSFPPKGKSKTPFGKTPERKTEEKEAKQPYYETYNPDPPTADPSQTMPGAPDIRNPDTKLPEGTDLSKLSPDMDFKK